MTSYKITLHSTLGRDDLHMELLELHERLKLYGVCVNMESTLKEEVDLLNTGVQTLTSKAAHLTAALKIERGWLDQAKDDKQALADKLEAIKALAPEILSWMGTGVGWARSESPGGREAEEEMQAEHDETVRQFKELLGIKEAS